VLAGPDTSGLQRDHTEPKVPQESCTTLSLTVRHYSCVEGDTETDMGTDAAVPSDTKQEGWLAQQQGAPLAQHTCSPLQVPHATPAQHTHPKNGPQTADQSALVGAACSA